MYAMNCIAAGLAACPNVQNIGLTYGYLSPSGIIPGQVNGVIVYFDGGGGTLPAGDSDNPLPALQLLTYYFQQGYEIVQLAWSSDWEATLNPFPSPPPYGNIQNAACRPATFLNYVYNNIFRIVSQGSTNAGMCAQGFSGGSAQVAYSMAYYPIASLLDNVELISGPVFSDIYQGCVEPQASPVTVCPTGQYGCQPGSASWTLSPTYLPGANQGVGNWTNDQSCGVPGSTTSFPSNARWRAQSIVDLGTGAPATFSYPNTAIAGWLCRSVKNSSDCPTNPKDCPNNSSPQGEIFYSQITATNPPLSYNVYAVDQCGGAEGVYEGNVPALPGDPPGLTAIEQDMAGAPPPLNIPAKCVHSQH